MLVRFDSPKAEAKNITTPENARDQSTNRSRSTHGPSLAPPHASPRAAQVLEWTNGFRNRSGLLGWVTLTQPAATQPRMPFTCCPTRAGCSEFPSIQEIDFRHEESDSMGFPRLECTVGVFRNVASPDNLVLSPEICTSFVCRLIHVIPSPSQAAASRPCQLQERQGKSAGSSSTLGYNRRYAPRRSTHRAGNQVGLWGAWMALLSMSLTDTRHETVGNSRQPPGGLQLSMFAGRANSRRDRTAVTIFRWRQSRSGPSATP